MDQISNTAVYEKIGEAIGQSLRCVIITHKKPDGDALGSTFALYAALKRMNKDVHMACIDPVPEYLKFLPHWDEVKNDFQLESFDTLISLDCGAYYMSQFHEKYPNIFNTNERRVINIDHHPSNDHFGDINLILTNAASTSMILYQLFLFLEIPITSEMATCLLTGLYTDTGSFMHSNTSAEVYRIASELIKKGGKYRKIVKECFRTTQLKTLRLWGKVLSNLRINHENIAMAVLTQRDFETCEATNEDLAGVIDLLNAIPEAKFSVLLTEDKKGNVKGSFRTQRNDINLSKIAGVFGGGGHEKAAGFTIPGRLEKEVRWTIVKNEMDVEKT